MKKIAFILMMSALMFAVVSCDSGGGGGGGGGGNITVPEPTNPTNPTKKFWAQNAVTKVFYQFDAEKLADNSRCEVWVEKGSGVTAATARNIANEYSNNIYTKMMNAFGYTINDTDLGRVNTMEIAHWLATGRTSGAKLTILLLDIRDGYTTRGDPYVAGYFYALDLLGNDPDYPQYKSNELDMIYLDTYPSVPGSSDSNETLAHEMQHLMNFVSNVVFRVNNNTLYLMDTWVNEGLSAAAEWIYSGKYSEERWKHYNEDPSGLIKKGNNFYVWDNHKDNAYANLDDYATVYLFFQWLRLQSGTSIYYNIHTSNFSDYRAVTSDWPLLLRDWLAANFTNAPSGRYGYMNDNTLKAVKAPMVPAGTTSLPLFPGEGVYSRTTTSGTVPGTSGNIRYAGLPAVSGNPSNTASFADGARLTYNVNTDLEGVSASGSTTGIAPSVGISTPGSGSVQTGSSKFSGSFKVDMGYFQRRNGNSGISDNEIRSLLNKSNGRSVGKNSGTVKFDISTLERVFIDE
jgi:hypothetical protein